MPVCLYVRVPVCLYYHISQSSRHQDDVICGFDVSQFVKDNVEEEKHMVRRLSFPFVGDFMPAVLIFAPLHW